MRLDLNLLDFADRLVIETRDAGRVIFDPVRKRKMVLTPEELVRQLLVQYLIGEKEYPLARFRVEKGLKVNTRLKRCDILIYDRQAQPYIIVECKSAKVEINDTVFEQIARYNITLRVPILIVSNGIATYCCKINLQEKTWAFLKDIPFFDVKI